MNCYISAMIGAGLITASYFTLSVTDEQEDKMKQVLSKELADKYEDIIEERRNHYLLGLAFGTLVAYFFFQSFPLIKNTFMKITSFFTVALTIAVVFYMLMPKSDYMLNHLKTEKQNKVWLEIYKTMKHRYFFGFALGAVAIIPFAQSLC